MLAVFQAPLAMGSLAQACRRGGLNHRQVARTNATMSKSWMAVLPLIRNAVGAG